MTALRLTGVILLGPTSLLCIAGNLQLTWRGLKRQCLSGRCR